MSRVLHCTAVGTIYAVRGVPIPSDFGIGTVSCVHVYACFVALRAPSFVVYRPVRFSCSDICTIVTLHATCGARSRTRHFFAQSGTKCVPRKVSAGRGTFSPKAGLSRPKRDCPAQSGTVGQSEIETLIHVQC